MGQQAKSCSWTVNKTVEKVADACNTWPWFIWTNNVFCDTCLNHCLLYCPTDHCAFLTLLRASQSHLSCLIFTGSIILHTCSTEKYAALQLAAGDSHPSGRCVICGTVWQAWLVLAEFLLMSLELYLCLLDAKNDTWTAAYAGFASMLPATSAERLNSAVAGLDSIAHESLTPLFKAITERLEHTLLQMHEEAFGSATASTTTIRSKVRVLVVCLCFRGSYVVLFPPSYYRDVIFL